MRALYLIALAALSLPSCAESAVKPTKTKASKMSLFNFIDHVAGMPRLDRASVSGLSMQALEADRGNEYFSIHSLSPLRIDAELETTSAELREPRAGSGATGKALLVLKLKGRCVTRDAVQQKYPQMALIDTPRGRSADERWSYEIRLANTLVRFGFDQSDALCLTDMSFEKAA